MKTTEDTNPLSSTEKEEIVRLFPTYIGALETLANAADGMFGIPGKDEISNMLASIKRSDKNDILNIFLENLSNRKDWSRLAFIKHILEEKSYTKSQECSWHIEAPHKPLFVRQSLKFPPLRKKQTKQTSFPRIPVVDGTTWKHVSNLNTNQGNLLCGELLEKMSTLGKHFVVQLDECLYQCDEESRLLRWRDVYGNSSWSVLIICRDHNKDDVDDPFLSSGFCFPIMWKNICSSEQEQHVMLLGDQSSYLQNIFTGRTIVHVGGNNPKKWAQELHSCTGPLRLFYCLTWGGGRVDIENKGIMFQIQRLFLLPVLEQIDVLVGDSPSLQAGTAYAQDFVNVFVNFLPEIKCRGWSLPQEKSSFYENLYTDPGLDIVSLPSDPMKRIQPFIPIIPKDKDDENVKNVAILIATILDKQLLLSTKQLGEHIRAKIIYDLDILYSKLKNLDHGWFFFRREHLEHYVKQLRYYPI